MPPTAPRWRLGLGAMMVGVAAVALSLWGGKQVAVSHQLKGAQSSIYFVGDLLPTHSKSSTISEITSVANLLKSSVPEDKWWFGKRTVTPMQLSLTLIVYDTKAGHTQVQAWLHQQRSRLKPHAN